MNIDLNRGMPQIPPQAPYILIVPGLALAALGIIIIVNPAIIAFMVGGFMVLIGILLAFLGWRLLQKLK